MNIKNSSKERYKKALDYSLRLLARKDRTEHDIRIRLLKRGYDLETVNEVISRLKGLGYINEEVLLNKLVNVALKEKNYGRYYIRQFLVSKGIDERVFADLNIPDDDYREAARRFVEKKKKLLVSKDDNETKNKLIQMLLRRGHDIDTIKGVLNITEGLDG